MTQSTQSSSKKRLLYHFFIGNLARRNKRGRSPPCSSSSSLPVQSLALTDNNNNSIENEHIVHRDEIISDRIHYYPLTRYYVIVLMSLATIILSSSFILPSCTATALADPVPIRISHSYSALKDAAPKDSSEYKIKSSNKNSNYANNNSSNNANSPLTSFTQTQPFYTRLSVQENAFRPSYMYATKTIPTASTTSRAALLRGEESTTTTDPVTITNKRLSHDPFFNFVNNFQSLTSTESSIDRSSSNTDNLPATQLQTERSKKKKSRKRTRQDDDGPFAFPLPNPIVITSTTSKPTLHPLLVLETEMRTTTSSTPSPIKDESSAVLPSVNTEDITQPNSGPFPEGRANSDNSGSPPVGKISFEEYNELRKSKNKRKPTTTTTTENYLSNHNGGFSPSSGIVPNGSDSKRLRSNFFDNFHDTDIDNIAEESGGQEVAVDGNENGPEGGTLVNIPAGYSYAKKQNPGEEFHYSEATNGNSDNNNEEPQRNEQNSNNHHQQYQLKPSLHFPSNNYHSGGGFQPSQPVHRFPPKPISKLRPNLQSYYDNSYHKFTAAAENQYENHGNSYGSRPPSPNYPPLPHLPLPIAIPMSNFPSPHQPPHMRPFMHHHAGHGPPLLHHHRNNLGSHYYGNNFATGLSTKPTQEIPTGDSNVNPSGGGDNSLENDNHQQNNNNIQITNPSGPSIPTLPVTVFSSPTTYGLEHSASESGLHTNKKVGIMDTFEIFYKEYKILTWAAFLIVTSLGFLCLVVFLYVNNPPTEVVTARNHLQEMLTSPQLIKFLSSFIEGGGKTKRKSNSREGKNRWKLSATLQPKKDL